MKQIKNMTLGAFIAAGLCLGFSACSDEELANEEEKPLIFSSIESVYDSLGHETNCGKIIQYLTDRSVNNQQMEKACAKYNDSLKSIKSDPKKLSHEMDNSGYYMAAYLLTSKLSDTIDACDGEQGSPKVAAQAYVSFFQANGCDTYLDDAIKVTAKK